MPINGYAIAAVAGGSIFVYAGLKGKSVLATLQSIVKGSSPSTAPSVNTIGTSVGVSTGSPTVTPTGGQPSGGSDSQNQALGKQMASAYGWGSGAEWTALNNLVMGESGWNAYAANPTSSARGIAQNINGWSTSYQAGNAMQQIQWMLSYIQQKYGDPIKAWKFWQAQNPHWY